MESLYFLVPSGLIFIAIAIKILFWAINNGQYDNLDTEAHRIFFDDEKTNTTNQASEPPEQQQAQKPEQKSEQKSE